MGTRDALFAINILIQKCWDMQMDVFLCFVDYEKAFDRVQHEVLVRHLHSIGLDEKDVRIIQNLYWNQTATVRVEGEDTEEVAVCRGVRQGCILSPLLFNIYSEVIIAEALEDQDLGVVINGHRINNIRYADDTVLIASNPVELQNIVDRVYRCSSCAGLSMNLSKTKFMMISRDDSQNHTISVAGNTIDRVSRYKYLGTWATEKWDSDMEIKCRIEVARASFTKMKKVLTSHWT